MPANIQKRRLGILVVSLLFLIVLTLNQEYAATLFANAVSSGALRKCLCILCGALALAEIWLKVGFSEEQSTVNNVLNPIFHQSTQFSLINCGVYLIHGSYEQGFNDIIYFNFLSGVDLFFIFVAGFIACIFGALHIFSSISFILTNPHKIAHKPLQVAK